MNHHPPTPHLGSSHRNRILRVMARSAAAGLLGVLLLSTADSAHAAPYPSWDEVVAAKSDEAAARVKAQQLREALTALQAQSATTAEAARTRGEEYRTARDALDTATGRAAALHDQSVTAATTAASAEHVAGRLASQLHRSGGTDLSLKLFLGEPSTRTESATAASKNFLRSLGLMERLAQRTDRIHNAAVAARNTASGLARQADAAAEERQRLQTLASAALTQARAAAEADAAAVVDAEQQTTELRAKLSALSDQTNRTVADYQAGVAAAEAAQLAAQAAANAAAQANSTAGTSSSGAGAGWVRPATGRITDHYGPRVPICGSGGCSSDFHRGTDLGTGCGAPIYAAAAGTIAYAGWYGSYGNWIEIEHGGGVSTGYAHLREGGIVAWSGSVAAGQLIGWSGTTGASDGCHLHFEVRTGGSRINPVPFMSDRGAALG